MWANDNLFRGCRIVFQVRSATWADNDHSSFLPRHSEAINLDGRLIRLPASSFQWVPLAYRQCANPRHWKNAGGTGKKRAESGPGGFSAEQSVRRLSRLARRLPHTA
jgi:hypothetical protein